MTCDSNLKCELKLISFLPAPPPPPAEAGIAECSPSSERRGSGFLGTSFFYPGVCFTSGVRVGSREEQVERESSQVSDYSNNEAVRFLWAVPASPNWQVVSFSLWQLLLVLSRDPLLQHPGVRCALRVHLRLPLHPRASQRETTCCCSWDPFFGGQLFLQGKAGEGQKRNASKMTQDQPPSRRAIQQTQGSGILALPRGHRADCWKARPFQTLHFSTEPIFKP